MELLPLPCPGRKESFDAATARAIDPSACFRLGLICALAAIVAFAVRREMAKVRRRPA